MKEIPLTQGYVAQIDDEDYKRIGTRKWYAHIYSRSGRTYVYASRQIQVGPKKQREVALQYEVLGILPRPNQRVIAKNGNMLDCRKSNLRLVTKRVALAIANKPNRSGFRGVTERKGYWTARISYNGERVYLGSFPSAVEAAIAYNRAARSYFGELANLNDI